MSRSIVRDAARGVNVRTSDSACGCAPPPADAVLIEQHARLATLDEDGLLAELLAATAAMDPADPNVVTARLASIGIVGRRRGSAVAR